PGVAAEAVTLEATVRAEVHAVAVAAVDALHQAENPRRILRLRVPPSRAVPGEAARAAEVAGVVVHTTEALVRADDEGPHLTAGAIPHLRQPVGPFEVPVVAIRPRHDRSPSR